MKRLLALLAFILTGTFAFATGIEFFEGSLEDAKKKAIEEERIIFIDAYTTWCGPCKRMAKSVFTQESVGNFYNENFINMKIDMEKGKGPQIARQYRVRSYPTLLFVDGNGEVVHLAVGAKKPDDFIKLGEMVLRKNDKSADYEAEYKEGKRDPEFVMKYMKSLVKAGKPSLKVANDYLKTQDDLTTEFNRKFIFEAVTEADSRIFDMMAKDKNAIIKIFGQDAFDKKVIAVTNVTVNKAIEFESMDLLAEAKEKINIISDKERAKLFHVRADKKYYLKTGDVKNYIKTAGKYIKEFVGKDATKLNELAREASGHLSTEKKIIAKAAEWAGDAYDIDATPQNAYTYADLLFKNGDIDKAAKIAEKAKEKATEAGDRNSIVMFQRLLDTIRIQQGS